ncbi:MAG: tRNA(Ile)(2)-agmatinylcytidine synthase [Candidatus Heimdallarchaeota archaeon]
MTKKRDSILHIGFDDTDSLSGSCTTHIATKIIHRISEEVEFLDYPRLIRNNPNVPWKTRGNGAIAFTLGLKNENIENVFSTASQIIEDLHQKDPNTNPGLVAVKNHIPNEIKQFSINALKDVISINKAKAIARKFCSYHFTIGNGRGLIGAIAAIGNNLNPEKEDFSYELLSYRSPEYIGKKRQVSSESVRKMDKQLSPHVFNNIDEESGKILITPAGKDPVLYGIRGETPEVLLEAFDLVHVSEPVESFCIFRTNQGTDQHFNYSDSMIRNFSVYKGEIEVIEKPRILLGGHTIFNASTVKDNKIIDVAAFEPSKKFREVVRKLLPGDRIMAYGGIKYKQKYQKFTIQLEKCEVVHISEQFKEESPFCPNCSKRMISAGKNKGYKCRKCGHKDRNITKLRVPIIRNLTRGLYIPPAQAQRHLVKPFRRYNLSKKDNVNFVENWYKILSKTQ